MITFTNWLLEHDMPPTIKAYHGGAYFEKFDLNNIGTGETRKINPAYGPGIYFSDCKKIAELYTKYASGQKAIHEVELQASNLYDLQNGDPRLTPIIDKLFEKAKTLSTRKTYYSGYDGILSLLGPKQGIKFLAENGIDGCYGKLPPGCLEIVVINPEIIKVISVTKV